MLATFYILTAITASVLIMRNAPGSKEPIHFLVKIAGILFFGYMAYAGLSKGLEAIASGDTRLSNRLGLGRVANRNEIVFWAQLVMCWGASVLGTVVTLIFLLAPRPRDA
jgi:hypothetical protein